MRRITLYEPCTKNALCYRYYNNRSITITGALLRTNRPHKNFRRLVAPEICILQPARDLLYGNIMQTSPVRLFFVGLPHPFVVLCMAILVQCPPYYGIHVQ